MGIATALCADHHRLRHAAAAAAAARHRHESLFRSRTATVGHGPSAGPCGDRRQPQMRRPRDGASDLDPRAIRLQSHTGRRRAGPHRSGATAPAWTSSSPPAFPPPDTTTALFRSCVVKSPGLRANVLQCFTHQAFRSLNVGKHSSNKWTVCGRGERKGREKVEAEPSSANCRAAHAVARWRGVLSHCVNRRCQDQDILRHVRYAGAGCA